MNETRIEEKSQTKLYNLCHATYVMLLIVKQKISTDVYVIY